jgi:hypothetical protein
MCLSSLLLLSERRRIVHSLANGVVGGGGEDQVGSGRGLKAVAAGSTLEFTRGVRGAMVASSLWLLLNVCMVMAAAKEEEEGEGCRVIS